MLRLTLSLPQMASGMIYALDFSEFLSDLFELRCPWLSYSLEIVGNIFCYCSDYFQFIILCVGVQFFERS